jgi:heme-degrading monooxygenase HmoA
LTTLETVESPSTLSSDAVAVMLLVDIAAGSRWWGYSRFVLGRLPLRSVPGLRFVKVLGSGYESGFGLRPSISRQGLFCVFDNDAAADSFLHTSALVAAYRARAREFFAIKLRAFSSRGTWSGLKLPVGAAEPAHGPIAAITRASIRPKRARAFWQQAPLTQHSLEGAPGCLFSAGVGEAPLLRQATFTMWESVFHMNAYARSGAHLEAIKAAQRHGYFSESMFVRFVPYGARGVWLGRAYD